MTPEAAAATLGAQAPGSGAPLQLAIVALSGGVGCALRVSVRDALIRRGAHPWWSTCAINLSGALLMGLAAGAASTARPAIGPVPATVAAGVLAGWTTYSAFAMDVVQLWLRGARRQAAALWAVTLAGAPSLAFAGGLLVRAALGGVTP